MNGTKLYTATFKGKPLRFYEALVQPAMPYHVHEDLMQILDMPDDLRQKFRQMLADTFGDTCFKVADKDEIVVAAPHTVAQQLLNLFVTMGGEQYDPAKSFYEKSGAEAFRVQCNNLGLQTGTDPWFSYVKDCMTAA